MLEDKQGARPPAVSKATLTCWPASEKEALGVESAGVLMVMVDEIVVERTYGRQRRSNAMVSEEEANLRVLFRLLLLLEDRNPYPFGQGERWMDLERDGPSVGGRMFFASLDFHSCGRGRSVRRVAPVLKTRMQLCRSGSSATCARMLVDSRGSSHHDEKRISRAAVSRLLS